MTLVPTTLIEHQLLDFTQVDLCESLGISLDWVESAVSDMVKIINNPDTSILEDIYSPGDYVDSGTDYRLARNLLRLYHGTTALRIRVYDGYYVGEGINSSLFRETQIGKYRSKIDEVVVFFLGKNPPILHRDRLSVDQQEAV